MSHRISIISELYAWIVILSVLHTKHALLKYNFMIIYTYVLYKVRKEVNAMADFNKKYIGSLILEKTGAAQECADMFREKRTALHFDTGAGAYSPLSESEKLVADRLEEEKNYLTYAVIAAADGSPLYLVVTDEIVKLTNINIEYGNDPFDGVLKKTEDGQGFILHACGDAPDAMLQTVEVTAKNGILSCLR